MCSPYDAPNPGLTATSGVCSRRTRAWARAKKSPSGAYGATAASNAPKNHADRLWLAACAAAGLRRTEAELSALARRGSGSACRSVPGGYTEWLIGQGNATSFAHSVAPPSHWDLRDVVAVVSREHKAVGSSSGHSLAVSSPLHAARLLIIPALLTACKRALLARDLEAMGYLDHPHTSAGRVPTDEGYRFYVDGLPDAMYAAAGPIRSTQAPLVMGNFLDPTQLTDFGGELRLSRKRRHLTQVHDRHPGTQAVGFLHQVGGQENGAALRAQGFHQVPDSVTGLGIQARGQLVQEDQAGAVDQCQGYEEALELSA